MVKRVLPRIVVVGYVSRRHVRPSYVRHSMAKSPNRSSRPGNGGARTTAAPRRSAPVAPPATSRSEVVNLRVASSVVDQLDAAAEAAGTTRKVIITRALVKAGFQIPQHDLEDRTPRRRRSG